MRRRRASRSAAGPAPGGAELEERVDLHELDAGRLEDLGRGHACEGVLHHAAAAAVPVVVGVAEERALGVQQGEVDAPGVDADAGDLAACCGRGGEAALDLGEDAAARRCAARPAARTGPAVEAVGLGEAQALAVEAAHHHPAALRPEVGGQEAQRLCPRSPYFRSAAMTASVTAARSSPGRPRRSRTGRRRRAAPPRSPPASPAGRRAGTPSFPSSRASGRPSRFLMASRSAALSAGMRVIGTPSCDGQHQRPAVGVEHLRVPLGVGHRVGPADDAVVRQQHGVVLCDERQHRLGERLGPRRLVRARARRRPTKTSYSGMTHVGGTRPVIA